MKRLLAVEFLHLRCSRKVPSENNGNFLPARCSVKVQYESGGCKQPKRTGSHCPIESYSLKKDYLSREKAHNLMPTKCLVEVPCDYTKHGNKHEEVKDENGVVKPSKVENSEENSKDDGLDKVFDAELSNEEEGIQEEAEEIDKLILEGDKVSDSECSKEKEEETSEVSLSLAQFSISKISIRENMTIMVLPEVLRSEQILGQIVVQNRSVAKAVDENQSYKEHINMLSDTASTRLKGDYFGADDGILDKSLIKNFDPGGISISHKFRNDTHLRDGVDDSLKSVERLEAGINMSLFPLLRKSLSTTICSIIVDEWRRGEVCVGNLGLLKGPFSSIASNMNTDTFHMNFDPGGKHRIEPNTSDKRGQPIAVHQEEHSPNFILWVGNEYNNVGSSFSVEGKQYVLKAVKMAFGLDSQVPQIMCSPIHVPEFNEFGTRHGATTQFCKVHYMIKDSFICTYNFELDMKILALKLGFKLVVFHVIGSVYWKIHDCYVIDRCATFLENVCELKNGLDSLFIERTSKGCDTTSLSCALRWRLGMDVVCCIDLISRLFKEGKDHGAHKIFTNALCIDGRQDEIFEKYWQCSLHMGIGLDLARGRATSWEGWNDENDSNYQRRFFMIKQNVVTFSPCLGCLKVPCKVARVLQDGEWPRSSDIHKSEAGWLRSGILKVRSWTSFLCGGWTDVGTS